MLKRENLGTMSQIVFDLGTWVHGIWGGKIIFEFLDFYK